MTQILTQLMKCLQLCISEPIFNCKDVREACIPSSFSVYAQEAKDCVCVSVKPLLTGHGRSFIGIAKSSWFHGRVYFHCTYKYFFKVPYLEKKHKYPYLADFSLLWQLTEGWSLPSENDGDWLSMLSLSIQVMRIKKRQFCPTEHMWRSHHCHDYWCKNI